LVGGVSEMYPETGMKGPKHNGREKRPAHLLFEKKTAEKYLEGRTLCVQQS